jgi:hypothetical protein
MSTPQTPPADSTSDPSKQPLEQPLPFAPPAALDRPRNGATGDNGFNIDHVRHHDGGGRASNPFIPEFCKSSGK